MSGLIFNEEALLTNNVFKYEQRLKSPLVQLPKPSTITARLISDQLGEADESDDDEESSEEAKKPVPLTTHQRILANIHARTTDIGFGSRGSDAFI